ncbi:adenylate kinase family protein [Methanothermobacter sp. CaT2]|jgi:adenylate kinase|uniref:adenylate kinase family protein n=1 Tax=Methanothermobacter sp. CaT2 TaxID=866790 RepID=UPI0002CCEC1C|nr:adenylate kinase family protein [Methanothermobacter sp. CaT2]MBC7112318.1 adenylate kinase family protein [Methanothermobacter sp.]HIH70465.1 AAA family ATPase [Methanothermobacter thermautotrophicus]MDK2874294.1 adenylate kinase [Methanothermobacter sp.]MDN5373265.1 adenylate kinase [Methanothermobacter sp.]NLU04119.1 AAA family ATPase [Methanothermobacter sp.]
MICITGTPGVGKTTVAGILRERGLEVISLGELIRQKGFVLGRDPIRGYLEADIEAACSHLQEMEGLDVVEGHLSHLCRSCSMVIVLRLHPEVLRGRLEGRGYPEGKVLENLEAEALDVCTVEAFEIHGERVHEVDTTGRSPHEVADIITDIMNGSRVCPPGGVDFSGWLLG